MARKDRAPDPPKRPQGPQRRSTPTDPAAAARQRRILALVAGSGIVALVIVLGIIFLTGGGEDERAALTAAGCTLVVKPGQSAEHSVEVGAKSPKWNTDPPTSGPHNQTPAIWGSYEDPVPYSQTVHNLEHGGIVIHYGDGFPQSDLEALQNFYNDDPNGLVITRLPKLGNKITLSGWTTADSNPAEVGSTGNGYLATCSKFDEGAFSAFVEEHRFKGPERFPPESLAPGT